MLTIQAPAGAHVVFLINSLITLQSKAKIVLKGGITPNSIVFVTTGSVILGASSTFVGTLIAAGGCMADDKAKLTGAIFCQDSVTFGGGVKMAFAPLPTTFP